MKMGVRVSEIGSLFGDPVRAAMLTTLIDGRSLPAGELAFIGNVARLLCLVKGAQQQGHGLVQASGPAQTRHLGQPLGEAFEAQLGGREAGHPMDQHGAGGRIRAARKAERETRGAAKRVGFRLGKDTKDIALDDNTIEGFAVKVEDRKKGN